MKKKLLTAFLILSIITGITACGSEKPKDDGESSKTESTSADSEETAEEEIQNTYTIDGITITANNFSVEPYSDPNGEYTKRINVIFNFANDTDQAFGYMASCTGYLPDGYKLQSWSDISDMDLKQVPSHGNTDVTAYLLADDSVTLDKITVTYNFMDYNEEYWEDFGKIITGDMGEEEYNSKYGDVQELKFEITPQ